MEKKTKYVCMHRISLHGSIAYIGTLRVGNGSIAYIGTLSVGNLTLNM